MWAVTTRPLTWTRDKTIEMRLLILGGSGLVGQTLVTRVIQLNQADNSIHMMVPSRKPMTNFSNLVNPIIDYQQLDAASDYWRADAVICCLGTTKKVAGSVSEFIKIDHDYVIAAAQLAKQAGCRTFVYNSSLGANPNATSLYLKTKGMVETNLQSIGFERLILVRPGLLDNQGRKQSRPLETLTVGLFRSLGGFLPKRFRLVEPEKLADAMLNAAIDSSQGVTVIESQQI